MTPDERIQELETRLNAALGDNGKLRQRCERLEAAAVGLPHVAQDGMKEVLITNLLSSRDKSPRIDVRIDEHHFQFSAAEATRIASHMIETAAASYADAFLFQFAVNELNQEEDTAVAIVREFRKYRMDREAAMKEDQDS